MLVPPISPVLGGGRADRRGGPFAATPQIALLPAGGQGGGRGGRGIQTSHCLPGPRSGGSGGGADLGPRGASDTGLTEHQLLPHADGNSAAGPANGHSQDSCTHRPCGGPDTVRVWWQVAAGAPVLKRASDTP